MNKINKSQKKTQKTPIKKPSDSELSRIGAYLKNIEGISNFSEKNPETGDSLDKNSLIGTFEYNEKKLNYISIDINGLLFLNFRMNVTFNKEEIKEKASNKNDLMMKINQQNSKTIGVKSFLVNESDSSYTISLNSEYILDSKVDNLNFIIHAINILSISSGTLDLQGS